MKSFANTALSVYSMNRVYCEINLPKVIESKTGQYYFPGCRNDDVGLWGKRNAILLNIRICERYSNCLICLINQ